MYPRIPLAPLLPLLAIAVALVAGSVAAEGDDDVVTVIDVNFHHLGDHFVPTYQPQQPEGLEYEATFTVSGVLENPAIKLWIRGQVPADEILIDYVKLYVNDQFLANLNEYAMGSGSIYEVDDEVEIEVSIEEGILTQGTNSLKIVTGWGHVTTDRDDIMFWNIRLVRAKPIDVSCNLLSPAPGDVHLPQVSTANVSLLVWNDRHVDALQWVLVTVDPGGANASFRWTQSRDEVELEPGATDHAWYPQAWWHTSKDILNRTWRLSARMSFHWSFPTEGPVDVMVVVRDDHTREHVYLFEEVLEVKTSLEHSGPISVTGESQGPLGPASWVAGGENLTVSVPPLAFAGMEGTYPPPGTYSLSLRWGEVEVARSEQVPGQPWSTGWRVPLSGRDSVVLSLVVLDLPLGAKGPDAILVPLEVDGAGPSWLGAGPGDGDWLSRGNAEGWADLTDSDGSGVDPFSVEYQLWIASDGWWGPWTAAGLLPGGGASGHDRAVASLSLPEGSGHKIRWRATDAVGNGPVVSRTTSFGVDGKQVVLDARGYDGWLVETGFIASCTVTDPDPGTGSSGVDPSSVQASALLGEGGAWGEWTSPDSVEVAVDGSSAHATWSLALAEGAGNHVRWRATDAAGNPVTVSEPVNLWVDTIAPTLVSHWPDDVTFDHAVDARAAARFTDGDGSGVDLSRVEFSTSLGAENDFGNWTASEGAEAVGDLVRIEVGLDDAEGHHNYVRWRVWDLAGNGPATFGPYRLRVNLPPTAVISAPMEDSRFGNEDPVLLSAEGSADPDGDALNVEWWSDRDGYLGSGHELRGTLSPGTHVIEMTVDDGLGGDHVVRETVTVVVEEPTTVKEPPSAWLFIVVVVAGVATAVALREVRQRRLRRLIDEL